MQGHRWMKFPKDQECDMMPGAGYHRPPEAVIDEYRTKLEWW
jgi:hypothetical protein